MTDNRSAATPSLSERAAEEIRALLGRRRMSGRELARRLGASPSWVNFRLTGSQPISLDDLQRFADVLDVPVTDLLPRTEEGRLITTAAPRGGTRAGTNERSTRLAEWPRSGGHTSRTPRPSSTQRPARLRAAHA
jgi:transcriptional regulator with XRE-family HTH domain